MKEKTLYMIGNAHLDPVWLWRWQEGFQEVKATFRSALDRMNEYPDFIFNSSSAAYYEWIENNEPEMFEEIKKRIKEGRWVLVGGWWIQPDCNIPSGESFIRQALYGQHYFKEKFGVTAEVGYNVDSFGHNAMLPQILKKSGLDSYVFLRPGPHEKGLPNGLFLWESSDGSKVTAFRIPYEYCSWGKELDNHILRCVAEVKAPINDTMCFYGVGNHGGGPTKQNIESIHELNEREDFPNLKISSVNEFFKHVKGYELPIVHGELLHHASGCYAAHSAVKIWNRKAENRLLVAEKFSVISNVITGQPYVENYKKAWHNVLFNQFHDILAGTSIETAYNDARDMYGEAMSIAGRGLNYAVQAISWDINIEQVEGMKPIVVFNPHSFESKVNVELESSTVKEGFILVDEEGKQVPMQIVHSDATAGGRCKISFMAELPALGYRVYKIIKQASTLNLEPVQCSDNVIENKNYRLEFDKETGFIKSLLKKDIKSELFSAPAARPVVIEDNSDTWSHNVRRYDKVIGEFKAKSIKRLEYGPVKSTIRVVSEYGSSKIVQDFTMYNELDQIDVKVLVDWHEKFKVLKIKFPVNIIFRKGTFEIPYGHIERELDGEEYPMQNWVDITGSISDKSDIVGISILNDGKYSYDVLNKEINLTVLRSPIYAHHDPLVPDPDGEYSFIDQGIQQFNYTIYPHNGGWEEACTVNKALELNQKAITIIESYHKGNLPQKYSFINIDKNNIVVSAMKKAEDNDDIILRLYETTREETKVTINLPKLERTLNVLFKPCEIKTFRIPKNTEKPVVETNLLEWNE
ncbi:alpha-mannosidase [Clostridium sp. USBA 49]|uniref:alpha-mannosidase n=1 Tax=Clostridium sp. USBA 49 TaxID=1881060 RepID=UPI000998FE2C|nr:alpha-mannosidase [Clostridium sp. USBA 49]SKA85327.1 alpha-mannosidase [Clostridium sp. USBA 49]